MSVLLFSFLHLDCSYFIFSFLYLSFWMFMHGFVLFYLIIFIDFGVDAVGLFQNGWHEAVLKSSKPTCTHKRAHASARVHTHTYTNTNTNTKTLTNTCRPAVECCV